MSVVRPFSVLSKDELALSKTGRFLSKAEILGVGVFSPPTESRNRREKNLGSRKWNWGGMPTILGVNFGCEFWGGLKSWKTKAEKFAINIRHQMR